MKINSVQVKVREVREEPYVGQHWPIRERDKVAAEDSDVEVVDCLRFRCQ